MRLQRLVATCVAMQTRNLKGECLLPNEQIARHDLFSSLLRRRELMACDLCARVQVTVDLLSTKRAPTVVVFD